MKRGERATLEDMRRAWILCILAQEGPEAARIVATRGNKEKIKQTIESLTDYPLSLRQMDVQKLEGLERAFRIRVGGFRVFFFVDKKSETVYVTSIEKRESAYEWWFVTGSHIIFRFHCHISLLRNPRSQQTRRPLDVFLFRFQSSRRHMWCYPRLWR